MGVLSGLEPAGVFKYFGEICNIPHGSGNTDEISSYCVSFAKEHGLEYKKDSYNNVIIWKDGTPGYENSPSVIIQGHMDMVCEKEPGYNIDFNKEGIKPRLENNTITAEGTTLGGDDGIAIAYALAILESDDIPHPPLEVVFTVDEETGMDGAAAIDCTSLKSHIMLNIDSEEEGCLLVSCAGGATVTAHLPVKREKVTGIPFTLSINGLKGGHSGVEIDKGRANPNILMGNALFSLSRKYSFRILSVNGGLKDNAIPREATAELIFDANIDTTGIEMHIKDLNSIYLQEYNSTDAGIKLEITNGIKTGDETNVYNVFDRRTETNIITALVYLPNGVQRMSPDIEGLVQTSLNLGILKTYDNEVRCNFSVRSSVSSEKEELISKISRLMDALGGTVSCTGVYPAWEYRKNSPLRSLMSAVFEEQYGKKPVIHAIHAGLECGLFAGKIPDLDCVSYGPDIKNIHTPQESMDVESVYRTWEYTLEVLKRLK